MFRDWEYCEKYPRVSIEQGYEDLMAYPYLAGALSEIGIHAEAEEIFKEYKKFIWNHSQEPWNKDYSGENGFDG